MHLPKPVGDRASQFHQALCSGRGANSEISASKRTCGRMRIATPLPPASKYLLTSFIVLLPDQGGTPSVHASTISLCRATSASLSMSKMEVPPRETIPPPMTILQRSGKAENQLGVIAITPCIDDLVMRVVAPSRTPCPFPEFEKRTLGLILSTYDRLLRSFGQPKASPQAAPSIVPRARYNMTLGDITMTTSIIIDDLAYTISTLDGLGQSGLAIEIRDYENVLID